jgi:large subunit ribosomal protein L18e
MRRETRSTNPDLVELVRLLRKKARENNAPIWKDVAERLSKPRQRRAKVNISRLSRHTRQDDQVVVPGKVLGAGLIDHGVTVAALAFSERAREKVLRAKGKCKLIPDLIKTNPKGANVKIFG